MNNPANRPVNESQVADNLKIIKDYLKRNKTASKTMVINVLAATRDIHYNSAKYAFYQLVGMGKVVIIRESIKV